ncbi:hypothetical protein LUZ60_014123 [Juncus effusus]|nr:hypothetical protein LUZ60_014123 [Juncus effusus]
MAIRVSHEEKLPPVASLTWSRLHNFTFLKPTWGEQRIMRHVLPRPCSTTQDKSSREMPENKKSTQKEKSSAKEKSPETMENSDIPWNLRRRKPCRKENSCNGGVNGVKEGKSKLFSISLLEKEIEADFLLMSGKKPHRRPKKRPKHLQKQIDELFPGMWLSAITPELYIVEEEIIRLINISAFIASEYS